MRAPALAPTNLPPTPETPRDEPPILLTLTPEQVRLVRVSVQHYQAGLIEETGRVRMLSLEEESRSIADHAAEATDLIWLLGRALSTPRNGTKPAPTAI